MAEEDDRGGEHAPDDGAPWDGGRAADGGLVGRQAGELAGGDEAVALRVVAEIERPGGDPDEAQRAEQVEGGAPSLPGHQHDHEQRRDARAEARGGVGEPLRGAAPLGGDPAGDDAGGAGERAGFAEPDEEAGGDQHEEAAGEAGRDGAEGPDEAEDGEREAGADAVPEIAAEELRRGVAIAEGREGEAEPDVREPHLALDEGAGDGEVHAVDVLDEVHQAEQDEHRSGGAAKHGGEGWAAARRGALVLALHRRTSSRGCPRVAAARRCTASRRNSHRVNGYCWIGHAGAVAPPAIGL